MNTAAGTLRPARPGTTRIYAPLGMLGYGFPEASLEAALAWAPS